MKNMKFVAMAAFTALTLLIMGPSAFAGNGKGMIRGFADGGGHCLYSAADDGRPFVSANQTRTKDRKKDGSCLLPMTDNGDSVLMAKGGRGESGGKRSGTGSAKGKGSGYGPGDGTGNSGAGPKDGSGNGNKNGDCH